MKKNPQAAAAGVWSILNAERLIAEIVNATGALGDCKQATNLLNHATVDRCLVAVGACRVGGQHDNLEVDGDGIPAVEDVEITRLELHFRRPCRQSTTP